MRSLVFQLAHAVKAQFDNFGKALKFAWQMYKLYAHFPQQITFAKASGELRTATALYITNLETAAKGFIRFMEETADGQQQWRSFRIERYVLG